jgi:hypothetical protein
MLSDYSAYLTNHQDEMKILDTRADELFFSKLPIRQCKTELGVLEGNPRIELVACKSYEIASHEKRGVTLERAFAPAWRAGEGPSLCNSPNCSSLRAVLF